MTDDSFARRLQMIEAGEKGDYSRVNTLLKEDPQLRSFSVYLQSAAGFHKDVIEKSLTLPNLDRTTSVYTATISELVNYAAKKGNKDIVGLVLDHSPSPAHDANQALKSMFNKLADDRGMEETPSADVGKLLIARGAQLTEAYSLHAGLIEAQRKRLSASRKKLTDFKKRLSGMAVKDIFKSGHNRGRSSPAAVLSTILTPLPRPRQPHGQHEARRPCPTIRTSVWRSWDEFTG